MDRRELIKIAGAAALATRVAQAAPRFFTPEEFALADDLKLVDGLSVQLNGKPFLKTGARQRAKVLDRMAKNEEHPKSPEEIFFHELKHRTVYAYYTSEIGIHREMTYKGNVPITEFVGYEVK